MNLKRIARLAALASLIATTGAASAGNDGRRSYAPSQGDLAVSLRIESSYTGTASEGELRLTLNVDNALPPTRPGQASAPLSTSGDLYGERDFCVFRTGTGRYSMTVDSANNLSGSFRASNGAGFIDYEVRFDTDGNAADGMQMTSGLTRTGHTGRSTSQDCGNGQNASLNVQFREADLVGAVSGSYVDTLRVKVVPY